MRGRKDDKRVLRAGNGRNNKKSHRPSFNRNNNRKSRGSPFGGNRNNRQYSRGEKNYNKKKKRSGKTVLIMIIVLLAFIIGAGAGVFMSFEAANNETANNNTTHIENVTVEMTTNLNESNDEVVFEEADAVDYNENESAKILGVEDNPYYNNVEHLY